MTSKETLERIKNTIVVRRNYNRVVSTFNQKEIETIEKDLEVLEILTKYDVLSVIGNDEDYEKVKWYIATHKKLDL